MTWFFIGCIPKPGATKVNTDTPLPVNPTVVTSTTDLPSATHEPSPTLPQGDHCLARENKFLPEHLGDGRIIFLEREGRSILGNLKDNLYQLTPPNIEIQPYLEDLELGIISPFLVSSNGLVLAFTHEQRQEQAIIQEMFLVNVSEDTEPKSILWDEENWAGLETWLADGQQLVVIPFYPQSTTRRDEIILFNPFTEQQQRLEPSFTYPKTSFIDKWWGLLGLSAVYDPTLTRVVYLEDNDTMVLWDMENEQELWRFVEPTLIRVQTPTWSPKGKYLVIVDLLGEENFFGPTEENSFQIVVVNRAGEALWKSTDYPYYGEWSSLMGSFTWSPDERYLSFTWEGPDNGDPQTYLLDTVHWEVLDYCLPGGPPIIWSPDSNRFIKIDRFAPASDDSVDTYENILVDLENEVIYELGEMTVRPVAWMRTGP